MNMDLLNCNGKLLDLTSPVVMGILNLTSDSFYDGGRYVDEALATEQINKMVEGGCKIIDIGAMSSRPGASISRPSEEIEKISPYIDLILSHHPEIFISVDTLHSSVADHVLSLGAHIINDISGGSYDSNMMEVVASFKAAFIMMHMNGLPSDMQLHPTYNNIVLDILSHFTNQIVRAKTKGITDIVIDPGFGFGKSIDHNYELLFKLETFRIFDLPVLIGISRKSMIYKYLNTNPSEALNGTTALHMVALQKGCKILRVHDVREAVECIALFEKLKLK